MSEVKNDKKMTKIKKVKKQQNQENTKSDKIRKSKIIKKCQKMVKNGENPFLGRKRKRRGSMRFGKNAPTRWLGKHVK